MADDQGTKEQLVSELRALRQHHARLEELFTKRKQAEALCDIARATGRRLGLDQLIDCTLGEAVKVMGADMGLLYLVDRTEKALVLKAHTGVPEQTLLRIGTVKFSSEDLRKMPKNEAPEVSVSRLFRDAVLRLMFAEMRVDQAVSVIAISFLGKSGLHGVLAVGRPGEHRFDQDDMELLEAVGKQAGVGIDNAMLSQEAGRLGGADGLTSLYNQAYFQQRLQEEVERSSRYGLEFSVVMLDVDDFERYCARCGRAPGNKIIEMLSTSIRSCIRKVDIACRFSGSKFAVLLPHTDPGGAQVVAEKLCQTAFNAFALTRRSTRFDLALSLGIASFPSDAQSPKQLIHRAEVALGTARRQGGNQACLASDTPSAVGTASGDVSRLTEDDKESSMQIAYAMAAAVDAKTHHGHSRNVAKHAVAAGEVLGLPRSKIRQLRTAALLHDIGKACLPDGLLEGWQALSQEELLLLRKHPEQGSTIVSQIPELAYCAPAIRHHHERYDGSGYPDGLGAKQIPIEARIIAVADAYDNITTPGSEYQMLLPQVALEELSRHASTQFDPQVVVAFTKAVLAGV